MHTFTSIATPTAQYSTCIRRRSIKSIYCFANEYRNNSKRKVYSANSKWKNKHQVQGFGERSDLRLLSSSTHISTRTPLQLSSTKNSTKNSTLDQKFRGAPQALSPGQLLKQRTCQHTHKQRPQTSNLYRLKATTFRIHYLAEHSTLTILAHRQKDQKTLFILIERTLKQTCSWDFPRAQHAFKNSMTHELCKSQYISRLTTFFIDVGAETSPATGCISQ